MRKQHILIIFVCALIMCSCQRTQAYNDSDSDACIKPPISYSPYHTDTFDTRKSVLPGSPWLEIARLPEFPQGVQGNYDIELLRLRGGYSEIWIKSCSVSTDDGNIFTPRNCGYAIFRTDTENLETVFTQIDESFHPFPKHTFLSADGAIWGIRSFNFIASGVPVLVYFDEVTQKFIEVRDLDNFLLGDNVPRIDSFSLEESGVLWIAGGQYLYSFNPSTRKAQAYKILKDEDPSYLTHATISPSGLMYLSIDGKNEVIRFSTEIGRVLDTIKIEMPIDQVNSKYSSSEENLEYFRVRSSFMGQNGRLWIHNYGWMESDGTWHMLLSRFPGFFVNLSDEMGYGWAIPEIVLEDSAGHLWFRSNSVGLVQFTPEKGEWCWFTTYQSNIVEDADHNLWMIADGKLYKYPLQP